MLVHYNSNFGDICVIVCMKIAGGRGSVSNCALFENWKLGIPVRINIYGNSAAKVTIIGT